MVVYGQQPAVRQTEPEVRSAVEVLEPPKPALPQYAFAMRVQAWDRDPYYVASSAKVRQVTVVASTEKEAHAEALRILPELKPSYYYRFWVDKVKDIRLLSEKEKEEIG